MYFISGYNIQIIKCKVNNDLKWKCKFLKSLNITRLKAYTNFNILAVPKNWNILIREWKRRRLQFFKPFLRLFDMNNPCEYLCLYERALKPVSLNLKLYFSSKILIKDFLTQRRQERHIHWLQKSCIHIWVSHYSFLDYGFLDSCVLIFIAIYVHDIFL